MRDCIEEGTLRAYADGALTLSQEAIVAMHLAQCEFCKGNLAALDVLTSEVRLLVNDSSPLPDSQLALGRLRSSIPKRSIEANSPTVAAYAGEAPRSRVYSRPMRLQPVAMGIGLASAMAAVLVLLFAVSGSSNTASKPASEFVPRGMVRHFTVSHIFTTTVEGQLGSNSIEEVWVTNGKTHLLRYSKSTTTGVESWTGGETWVEEDSVYRYNPSVANKTTVYKYPYDPRHLELYVPNEISYLLTIPNSKIVGDNILDGRPVTVIEAIADRVNPTPEAVYYPEGVAYAVTDYKLWVDKETSQVLKREHKSTFLDGSRKGKTQTQTFKVTANELKDAGEFAPDFFKFKLPYNASVVEAESPFGATPTPATVQASAFVPLDKVRYMKVAWTWQAPGIDNGRIDEIWLGNGKEHLLLRTNTLHVDVSKHVREHGVMFTRVTDEAVYVYYKYGDDAYKHYKYPYNQRFISWYVPQDIDSLLAIPRARIAGDDILDGRPVTVIESIMGKPSNIAAPDPTQREVATTDLRFWVDKESSLLLKRESVTTFVSGPRSGTTETETFRITFNELRDRSTVSEDFFEYEPSGTIIDGVLSPFDATPTPGR